MTLPPQKVHLSFSPGPFRMAMGLVAQPPDALFELDDRYLPEMAERRALLDTRRDVVFAALPGSEAARRAVFDLAADILPRRFPAAFTRQGGTLENRLTGEAWRLDDPGRDPLEAAGLLVQDDLCILAPGPDGPVLTAAVLCFPSRWSLAEKIGRPLAAIHGPVPLYGERLARPVDRFLAVLAEGKLVERLNWSLVDDPALHQPAGHFRTALNLGITAGNAGETVFLKVERQTLSRITAAGDVLFTIRVHCYKLARVVADRQVAADLAGAVRALPEEMALYKSILPFRAALLAYLDRVATSPPRA